MSLLVKLTCRNTVTTSTIPCSDDCIYNGSFYPSVLGDTLHTTAIECCVCSHKAVASVWNFLAVMPDTDVFAIPETVQPTVDLSVKSMWERPRDHVPAARFPPCLGSSACDITT